MTVSRVMILSALLSLAGAVQAQDAYKAEPLKEAAPEAISSDIRETLGDTAIRVLDSEGKPFADFWVRKSVRATGKPEGSKGAVQFPVLSEGELLGAVRFLAEGQDYRDQAVPKGVYTIRYGLQPINGDHLGVSPYRDYALLLPAGKDKQVAPLDRKVLETRSAEAAGSSHPTVLLMMAAPATVTEAPSIARDNEKNLWSTVMKLPLTVGETKETTPLLVQIVISGAAM